MNAPHTNLLFEAGCRAPLGKASTPRFFGRGFSTLVIACLLTACSEPTPEARLSQAGEALDDVSVSLVDLNQDIASLRDDLDHYLETRDKLVERKMSLEERVARRATDVALFRAVQSKVLAEDALRNSAISVEVNDRVVTLSGKVASTEERDAALKLANSVAGVADVRSRLRTDTASDKATR